MSEPVEIDVLVVVQHDAEMVKRCLTSCKEGATDRVNLFTYINGTGKSFPDAVDRDVFDACDTLTPHTNLLWNDKNDGFIKPNNALAKLGSAPYICLLNADTVCSPGWDVPLANKLRTSYSLWEKPTALNPDWRHEAIPPAAIVGYGGGILGKDCLGLAFGLGGMVDYVEGWCLMTSRALWESLGGFDEQHLSLAYGEDSDLCLRAKELGYGVAAVENRQKFNTEFPFVRHLRDDSGVGKGASPEARNSPELAAAFQANHEYLRRRHKTYLETERVLVKGYLPPVGQIRQREYAPPMVYGTDSVYDDANGIGLEIGGDWIVQAREIDGRLWQIDIGGKPMRILLP